MTRTGNVRVCLRVRPREEGEKCCILVHEEDDRVTVKDGNTHHDFGFDRVFDEHTKQRTLYKEAVVQLVSDFVSGRNCCIFAYGQSRSGKTYTMMEPPSIKEDDDKSIKTGISSLGSAGVSEAPHRSDPVTADAPPNQVFTPKSRLLSSKVTEPHTPSTKVPSCAESSLPSTSTKNPPEKKPMQDESAGIVYRAVHDIFHSFRKRRRSQPRTETNKLKEPILKCSFLEMAHDNIFDLLDSERIPLALKSDKDRGTTVEGAIEKECTEEAEVAHLLQTGMSNRMIKRSPEALCEMTTVIILRIERYSRSKKKRVISSCFFVDLADSELVRLASSDSSGERNVQEAKSVKKNVGSLRKCLRSLGVKGKPPVPRDDSNLTRLLYAGLGRGAGISVLVTARPSQRFVSETSPVLRFGVYVAGQTYTPNSNSNNAKGSTASSPYSSSHRRKGIDLALPSQNRHSSSVKEATDNKSELHPSASSTLRAELEALRKENEDLRSTANIKDMELRRAQKEINTLSFRISDTKKVDGASGRVGPGSVNDSSSQTSGHFSTGPMVRDFSTGTMGKLLSTETYSSEPDIGTDHWCGTESAGKSNVRVCLRLRPMTKIETSRRSRSCIQVHEGLQEFTVDSPLDGEYDFNYDHVFDTDARQETVYRVVGQPILYDLFSGVNCCVIIYGASGSGKNHTLMGALPDELDHDREFFENDSYASRETLYEKEAGISPRLIGDIFRGMKDYPETIEFRISCSFVAIYLEKMYDLLEPQVGKTLYIRENSSDFCIEGASKACCFNEADVISLIQRGIACRSILGNRLNIDPKRSHTIFAISIEQTNTATGAIQRSYLHLAKIAAFEVQTKGKGQSIQETKLVHKSFSALGNVIKSLTEGSSEVPYRESKLTRILKDALGGNCKSTFIITASPSSYSISETTNAIRLGQRVRRIINNPRANGDVSVEHYRKWLLLTEVKLGELTSFVKELSTGMVKEANEENTNTHSYDLASTLWQSILAIVEEEDIEQNPCRSALVLQDSEELRKGRHKWRALSQELAKRMPCEGLIEVIQARDCAESLLSDIQSELVVLRRQNELLVYDKRKKDSELAEAKRNNKLSALKNSELEHKLGVAQGRSEEAITFLRYMRLLCWDLQTDISKSRPAEILEITSCLIGPPDLSGLVDLDTLMIDAGFIKSRDSDEAIQDDFIDYVAENDDVTKVNKEDAFVVEDQLAGLDETIRGNRASQNDGRGQASRWTGSGTTRPGNNRRVNADCRMDPLAFSRKSALLDSSNRSSSNILGVQVSMPWMRPNNQGEETDELLALENSRYSRRERELQRDLHTMTNKCVELQVLLNTERQTIDALTNRSGSLHKKRLAQETLKISQERDHMQHSAKAATWKLQELHVVNIVIAKQAASSKQQVTFLEEGFQRLQETFRTTVLDSLDADSQLRDRVENLQEMVDSLTGPGNDPSEQTVQSRLRLNVPMRGQMEERKTNNGHVDPSSELSQAQCLMRTATIKASLKIPVWVVHRLSKFPRRSQKTGTALCGCKKEKLKHATRIGKYLRLPRFEGEMTYSCR